MRFRAVVAAVTFLTLLSGGAFAADRAKAGPMLPKEFGGWRVSGDPQNSRDPAVADAANASLLKEYAFTDFESASYQRDDGRKLAVKAARFSDASGAYGAFTYYKMPQMLNEKIGDQAASLNERVLFYRGNVLVDAVFDRLTAMSAAELRELADTLPLAGGSSRNLPGLPAYLPRQAYETNTAKYVVGPVALEKVSAPLTAALVDFNAGAEVVLGNYQSSGGDATLMLISYPTPQIAAEHLHRIEATQQPNGASQTSPSPIMQIGPLFARRTGPIVVVAAGPISKSEARSLLASVNYEADVTWNENTYLSKKDNIGVLVWNALILSGILMLFGLAIGLAFGGVRVLISRLFPQKIFDRPEDVEFISLHLDEGSLEGPNSEVSSSIKVG
jgi:hypothetical protein